MIRLLEMLVLLLSENGNQMKIDKTSWYSIDYEKMQELEDSQMERQDHPINENAPEEDSERKKESDT
jgi:hypothetical protein